MPRRRAWAWGPRIEHVPAGIGLGLLGLAIGLSKGQVFLGVLSALPPTAARLASAIAIGAGVAGPLVGSLFSVRTEATRPASGVLSPR